MIGGETEIRTRGAIADTLAFQASGLSHSPTSPGGVIILKYLNSYIYSQTLFDTIFDTTRILLVILNPSEPAKPRPVRDREGLQMISVIERHRLER
jgi:hypothetical protein